MFKTESPTMFQCAIIALSALTIALSGCRSGETPTPTATPLPPSVTLVVNPDIKDVLAGNSLALVVEAEASGQNLRYKWSATRGRLSAFDVPAVIYTAPDTAGVDTVTVEVSSAAGTTTRNKSFNIVFPTPTFTPSPTPTVTPTPTQTLTLTPPPGTISDFNDGTTQGWLAAHWSYTETAISVLPSDQAGHPSGALWGNFDFGRTQSDWPRATFYLTLPSGPEDWTSTIEVRFDAQALPATGGDVKATIIVKTTDDFCYNEHGEFQHVGRTWTTLTFPLHVEQYKNCEDSDGYDVPLIAGDQVVELALVFIPSDRNARFPGEILIDNVIRLIQQP